tara:strand:+ start:308 stop:739 length:432 start_codon:yes stop_codon:yes gene_type:complete
MTNEELSINLEAMQDGTSGVDALPRDKDQLLPALLAMHQALDWLPREAISYVANHVQVPLSEVYATTTAYSELRLEPPVPGQWHVCTGIACNLAGADKLLDQIPNTARIDCQFLCALAPVICDEDEQLFGRVSVEEFRDRVNS